MRAAACSEIDWCSVLQMFAEVRGKLFELLASDEVSDCRGEGMRSVARAATAAVCSRGGNERVRATGCGCEDWECAGAIPVSVVVWRQGAHVLRTLPIAAVTYLIFSLLPLVYLI